MALQYGYAKVQAENQLTRWVIPNNQVSDSVQSDGSLGLVKMSNPNLKPWIGYNQDVRLIYYTSSGGDIGVDVFRDSIHNWQVSTTALLGTTDDTAAYGLSDQYVGYDVNTLFNNGNARIDGVEFEMRQSLDRFLPVWARGIMVSSTFSYTNLVGQQPNSDLGSVYKYRGTLYFRYSRRKLSLDLGWARNGPNENGIVTPSGLGVTGIQTQRPQDLIDIGASYAVTKWAKLFFSGRNIHGAWRLREANIPGAPSYAQLNSSNNIGITYTMGVQGQF
jgi:outer membrane receptor protein involved in Fe transport